MKALKDRFALKSVHLFDDWENTCWRCFAFRQTPTGFNASVAEGYGKTILECLADVEDSLKIGPIKANEKKSARLGVTNDALPNTQNKKD